MDTARYVLALLVVLGYPFALFYWVLVHSLTGFWRKLGIAPSYTIILTVTVALALGIYQLRRVILAVDFEASWLLVSAAVILFGASMAIDIRCRKLLSFQTLVGVPELSAKGSRGGAPTSWSWSSFRVCI